MYDPKQKHQELHTSERTIVPRTVIFINILGILINILGILFNILGILFTILGGPLRIDCWDCGGTLNDS